MNAKTNEYRVDIASEWRNVLKTPANLHLLSTQLSVLCAMAEADATARAEAAEADARECRAERARYGDMMTSRLATAEAERDALREINEVLSGKLDDMVIVNGQALACSSYVRAEVDALREKVAALRFTCKDVVSNLEAPIVWTDRDSEVAAAILRGTLDATA